MPEVGRATPGSLPPRHANKCQGSIDSMDVQRIMLVGGRRFYQFTAIRQKLVLNRSTAYYLLINGSPFIKQRN